MAHHDGWVTANGDWMPGGTYVLWRTNIPTPRWADMSYPPGWGRSPMGMDEPRRPDPDATRPHVSRSISTGVDT